MTETYLSSECFTSSHEMRSYSAFLCFTRRHSLKQLLQQYIVKSVTFESFINTSMFDSNFCFQSKLLSIIFVVSFFLRMKSMVAVFLTCFSLRMYFGCLWVGNWLLNHSQSDYRNMKLLQMLRKWLNSSFFPPSSQFSCSLLRWSCTMNLLWFLLWLMQPNRLLRFLHTAHSPSFYISNVQAYTCMHKHINDLHTYLWFSKVWTVSLRLNKRCSPFQK